MGKTSVKWTKISSVEELRMYGQSFRELKAELSKMISPLKFSAKSYKELFDIILYLKQNWLPFHEGPFVSKQAEVVFNLLHVIPKHRNNFLKITDDLYTSKRKANKWYRNMCKIVHPDKGIDDSAFKVLTALHENMIDVEE